MPRNRDKEAKSYLVARGLDQSHFQTGQYLAASRFQSGFDELSAAVWWDVRQPRMSNISSLINVSNPADEEHTYKEIS